MVASFLRAMVSEGAWFGAPLKLSLRPTGVAQRRQARCAVGLARVGLQRCGDGSRAGQGFW
jgi:hypothetical protein